jgi:hypothetical protein
LDLSEATWGLVEIKGFAEETRRADNPPKKLIATVHPEIEAELQ